MMQNKLYRLSGGAILGYKVTDGSMVNLEDKIVAIVSQTRRMLTVTIRVLVGEELYDIHFRDPPISGHWLDRRGFGFAQTNAVLQTNCFREWPDCLEDEGQEEEKEEEQSSV